MSKLSFVFLFVFILICVQFVNSQNVQITQWQGIWISDYVQNSPKYYQALVSKMKCSQAKFVLNVNSGSAVNVAIKKNSLASFDSYDYKVNNVQESVSYVYRGLDQENDQIYVIVNGARAIWNLYSLNFECL